MKRFFLFLLFPIFTFATIKAGVAKTDLTPPIGTPSAGYINRKGAGMEGVHDPLLAIALVVDNGEKTIAFCSVDHLGFTHEMVQEIMQRVKKNEQLASADIYIGSSHTHSGGGAFLNIPLIGEMLAGRYNPDIVEFYIEQTVHAICVAAKNRVPAKIGIGYGAASGLSVYRGSWPLNLTPLTDVSLIKVEHLDGTPLAALFNFPVHPTILNSDNHLFSSDFVGCARDHLESLAGAQPLYFNGAQGDINPIVSDKKNRFDSCKSLGKSLAEAAFGIWEATPTSENLAIESKKEIYDFIPQATPSGPAPPIPAYKSELNLLVLNQTHAFVSIPGELSCFYDQQLKKAGRDLGYTKVSILGLTNDAHGYIILPESWRHKTFESNLSFGGEGYGDKTEKRALELLQALAPSR